VQKEGSIRIEVQKAWSQLDKGQEVVFDAVGAFRNYKNRNLFFTLAETENFLTYSYGLLLSGFHP
jgi:hypothetical protein